jgi:MscS family membrane protein
MITSYALHDWLPALTVLVGTVVVYILFRVISIKVIRLILDKLPIDADQNIATAVYRPGRMAIASGGMAGLLQAAPLSLGIWGDAAIVFFKTLIIIAFYWIFYNLFSSTNYVFQYLTAKGKWKLDATISNFISMILRLLIIILAVASVLSFWNIDISGLIAGLSIGGLAVSLAAKDSLSNIFACCIIMLDHPFRVGDWIVCNDIEGVVESISFRSTNVRTPVQGLVNIPNSMIISTPITNYTKRDRRRIELTLGVTYDTTPEQMEELISKIKSALKTLPHILNEDMTVAFTALADSSLNITIICYTHIISFTEYYEVKEEVNLALMRAMKEVGVSAAFPSQSVYVEKMPEKAPGK